MYRDFRIVIIVVFLGVESLVEHRVTADPSEDPRLIRLSVGVEDLEDLKKDLKQGLLQVAKVL